MKPLLRDFLKRVGVLNFFRRSRRWLRGRSLLVARLLIAPKFSVGGPVLLNLGCGEHSGPGFTNIDVRRLPNIHYVHDIRRLTMFASGTVDLVYACHVAEHFPRHELVGVLKEWCRVLRPGGTLRISVPDFDALLRVYAASGGRTDSIVNQLMGQEPPYDCHYSIWSEHDTRELFAELGLTNFRRWDPERALHHTFRDKSARRMKAGEEEVLVSLNVEASKI